MVVDAYAMGPMILLESDEEMNLKVNQKTKAVLSNIDKPLVVVSIVGRYRTGKSYLLNRLARGGDSGFELGHTTNAQTRGIWVWPLPHPRDDSKCLLLLDTEGLGNNKGSSNHDTWLFVMSILLSSTLVLNTMRTLDKDSFELLHIVSNMAKHVNMELQENPSADADQEEVNYKMISPAFVVSIRDSLKTPGSSDEYMEDCLKNGKRSPMFKETCEMLCKYFPERKCFMFPMPAPLYDFAELNDFPEDKFNPEFMKTLDDFESHILEEGRVKHINKTVLRGPQFVHILDEYVAALHSGTVPSIEKALASVTKWSNDKAVAGALEIYKKGMDSAGMELPVHLLELEKHHKKYMEMAVNHFHDKSVLDCEFAHQEICMTQLLVERNTWINKNREASLNKCREYLDKLFRPLKERVDQGEFKHHGSTKELNIETEKLKEKYMATPELGDQAENALELFLNKNEAWLKKHPKVVEEGAGSAQKIHGRNVYDSAYRQAIMDLFQANKDAFLLKMEDTERKTGMCTELELSCQEFKLLSFENKAELKNMVHFGTAKGMKLALGSLPIILLAFVVVKIILK